MSADRHREVVIAVDELTHSIGAITFDVGISLRCTTRSAAARLRAAQRAGLVESYRQPPEYGDSDTYWRLTPTGEKERMGRSDG